MIQIVDGRLAEPPHEGPGWVCYAFVRFARQEEAARAIDTEASTPAPYFSPRVHAESITAQQLLARPQDTGSRPRIG
jgi:hypothetical protein